MDEARGAAEGLAAAFERWSKDHRVALWEGPGGVEVSTVRLPIDHGWRGTGPLWYETLVFGGPRAGEMERYATRGEAVKGHARMVARVISDTPK